jgi:hypothetical protein
MERVVEPGGEVGRVEEGEGGHAGHNHVERLLPEHDLPSFMIN